MAASSTNRERMRDELSDLLNTYLVAGGVIDKEFGYKTDDFGKPVSVVVVTSAGTQREMNVGDNTWNTWFKFDVWSFTLASLEADGWTRAHAEDKRDLIEKTIADVYMDFYSTDLWLKLEFDGQTECGEDTLAELDGLHYLIERIPTRMLIAQG